MSSIARPLAHMPYFERLAELANDSAEWRSLSAALVVLLGMWLAARKVVTAEVINLVEEHVSAKSTEKH